MFTIYRYLYAANAKVKLFELFHDLVAAIQYYHLIYKYFQTDNHVLYLKLLYLVSKSIHLKRQHHIIFHVSNTMSRLNKNHCLINTNIDKNCVSYKNTGKDLMRTYNNHFEFFNNWLYYIEIKNNLHEKMCGKHSVISVGISEMWTNPDCFNLFAFRWSGVLDSVFSSFAKTTQF